jgi:hypothetical protein
MRSAGSALVDERVQPNAVGQVELKLKAQWRDGTTQLVESPPEFMQRLAVPGSATPAASAAVARGSGPDPKGAAPDGTASAARPDATAP